MVELLVVLSLVGTVVGIGVPPLLQAARMKETSDAGAYLAGQFRMARQRAVLTGRNVGLVFDESLADLTWRVCQDDDRDGVSRADISAGRDTCTREVYRISSLFPHVQPGYHPGVPPISGSSTSALRLGVGRMAVFTPTGTASSGSVILKGVGGTQIALRVSGVTGRTRVVRFVRGQGLGIGQWAQ